MNKLRFGIIGWGYWGPKIARNLNTVHDAMVTIVADHDAYRLKAATESLPGVQTTTSAQDVFRSDVDGVIIATPVQTHYRLAREALVQGKHVLVEKPLTTNVMEAQDLVELAKQERRILMVGHTFVYNPAVNELRRLVQSGDLGKIYRVEAERVNLCLFRADTNVIWDLA
ncbi:MAG: Gfo/Idh/MocA family oxidoreductase, partial [Chloroflexi bacterium]